MTSIDRLNGYLQKYGDKTRLAFLVTGGAGLDRNLAVLSKLQADYPENLELKLALVCGVGLLAFGSLFLIIKLAKGQDGSPDWRGQERNSTARRLKRRKSRKGTRTPPNDPDDSERWKEQVAAAEELRREREKYEQSRK